MATGNFSFKNRCIVVTNDDYEMHNLPPMGEKYNGYTGDRQLAVSSDFDFWDIYLRPGYYEHACIDYERNDNTIEYRLGRGYYYDTQKAFFNECHTEYHISFYQLRKVCGTIKQANNNFDEWLEQAYDKLTDYLAEKEEDKVNEYLNGVMQSYGYEEYAVLWRASNGETAYKKIS